MGRMPGLPATPKSFTADAALMLKLLKRFSEAQAEELRELLGPLYKPNQLGVELMRQVCLSVTTGETKHVAGLQRDLKLYGGRATISRALQMLDQAGLVVIAPDPRKANAARVVPSERLARFYNRGAPGVIRELRRALGA